METLFTTIIMSYMIIFLIIISAEFLEAMPNNSERSTLAYTSSHDFLFISGWPQSGTSLMQQIFAVSPRTSTMIDKCTEQIPGRHCLDWNYEGQWLLRYQPEPARLVNSNASNLINAGSMCEAVYPTQESQEVSIISYADQKLLLEQEYKRGGDLTQSPYWTNHWDGIYNISSTWGKFWNLEKPLLVEKSPQSMLKSNLLREIFSNARSIKFVIMLKVSIDTALVYVTLETTSNQVIILMLIVEILPSNFAASCNTQCRITEGFRMGDWRSQKNRQ